MSDTTRDTKNAATDASVETLQPTDHALLEWEAIFDNAAVGISFTRGGAILRCNARAAAILGYVPQELVGASVLVIHPSRDSYERMNLEAARTLATGGTFETNCQFKHKDGSLVWCRVCAKGVNRERRERGTVWIIEDISTARAVQEQLRGTLREFQALFSNASVGILYTSARKIQRFNPRFAEMFGFTGDDGIGQPGRILYRSDEEYAEVGRLAGPSLSQGKPFRHELYMRHQNGGDFWANLIGYVADPQDPMRGTWWIVEDRSAFKQAEQALQRNYGELKAAHEQLATAHAQLLHAEKMASIGQLAAGVAHEINNPIGFITSNVGSLGRYIGDLFSLLSAYERAVAQVSLPAQAEREIAAAREAADIDYLREDAPDLLRESLEGLDRVRRIVQDLKDFSRVNESEWQMADLNAGVQSTLNMASSELRGKAQVALALGELPLVHCNPGQINQVLMNLLLNAGQAVGREGAITIRSGLDGEWAWVEVEDNGCGIAPDIQARIFDPFFTTKPVGQGTGLGLTIAYGIVNRHGGRLDVRSTPGAGSSFRIWLPVAGAAPTSSRGSAPIASP